MRSPSRLLALQRDPHEPRRHLLDQGGGGEGELDEEGGLRPGVLLHGEADVAAAVPEEGPRDLAPQGGWHGGLGGHVEPPAGWEEGWDGEHGDEGPEEAAGAPDEGLLVNAIAAAGGAAVVGRDYLACALAAAASWYTCHYYLLMLHHGLFFLCVCVCFLTKYQKIV